MESWFQQVKPISLFTWTHLECEFKQFQPGVGLSYSSVNRRRLAALLSTKTEVNSQDVDHLCELPLIQSFLVGLKITQVTWADSNIKILLVYIFCQF